MKLFIPFFIIGISSCWSQVDTAGLHARLFEHVCFLASDDLQGRSAGSEYELKATEYVGDAFKDLKKIRVFTWKVPAQKKDSSQVLSTMKGFFIDNHSKNTILIGAHIDHIGFGDQLSMSFKTNEIHNGADDNASGVAVLIELGIYLSQKKQPVNFLIVPFTAHEIGTFGSKYLSEHLPKKVKNVCLMINLDMVGRMNPSPQELYASVSDPNVFPKMNDYCKIAATDNKKIQLLDTKHFVAKGIPAISFSTGMHEDYHKVTDDVKYLNLEGMAQICLFLRGYVMEQIQSIH